MSSEDALAFVFVGITGGFDVSRLHAGYTFTLGHGGRPREAFWNVALRRLTLGLAAVWGGYRLGRIAIQS